MVFERLQERHLDFATRYARAAREALEAFAGNPRVVVGTGDPVGRETPEESIRAMIDEVGRGRPRPAFLNGLSAVGRGRLVSRPYPNSICCT